MNFGALFLCFLFLFIKTEGNNYHGMSYFFKVMKLLKFVKP